VKGTGVEANVGVVDEADLMYEQHVHKQQRALSGPVTAISLGMCVGHRMLMSICMARKCTTLMAVLTPSRAAQTRDLRMEGALKDKEKATQSTQACDTRKILLEAGLKQGPITLPRSCVSFIKANPPVSLRSIGTNTETQALTKCTKNRSLKKYINGVIGLIVSRKAETVPFPAARDFKQNRV